MSDEELREAERRYMMLRSRHGLPPMMEVSLLSIERLHRMLLSVPCPRESCSARTGVRCDGRSNEYGEPLPRAVIHKERWLVVQPIVERWMMGEFCCEEFKERLHRTYHSKGCVHYRPPRKKVERTPEIEILQSLVWKVIRRKMPEGTSKHVLFRLVEDAAARGVVFRWQRFTPEERRYLMREFEVEEDEDEEEDE